MKELYLKLLLILMLCFSCSTNNKVAKKKPKPGKVELQKDDFEITGSNQLLALFSLKVIPNDSAKNQQIWTLKLNLSADKKVYTNNFYKKDTQYGVITELLKELMKVPFKESTSTNFEYNGTGFNTIETTQGTKIDTASLRVFIASAYKNNLQKINLITDNLYLKPTYDNDSPKTKAGKQALEKCLQSIITLRSNQESYTIGRAVFGPCLSLDTAMKIEFDIYPLQRYLQNIANKIEVPMSEILKSIPNEDTSSMAVEIKFSRINISAQVNELIKAIPKGIQTSQTLLFYTRGLPKGFKAGHLNFVEVSIKEQKLWVFKNGNLILETDIVTGNKRLGRITPSGNFTILSKNRNVTLRGPGYACPVSYWMPFFEGYGLHDANWRRKFGQTIFENSGSHGCVNIPPKNASIVFANVEVGTPVFIYE